MNIPASIIEPFEPLGIPKLYRDDNAARDALRHLVQDIKTHCDRSAPLSISGIRQLIKNRLAFVGAEDARITSNVPYRKNDVSCCIISVMYTRPNGSRCGSILPFSHKAGFKK